jgi:hypothetical protein
MRVKLPGLSIVLMAIFLVGGSIALAVPWRQGPANLNWGAWIIGYIGYAYIVIAAIIHAVTGK